MTEQGDSAIELKKKAQSLTSVADSLTGKLEGQSYKKSLALTPGVEFIFLNVSISYHFRHLRVADTSLWAWQIDTEITRLLFSWKGSWRQGGKFLISAMVSAVFTCGYCCGLHRPTH